MTHVSTTWYHYTGGMNVERVVTNVVGSIEYSAVRLGYAKNAEAVTFAVGEKWTWNGDCETPPSNASYTVTFKREFRYDGARQRYLVRQLDPDSTYTPVADVYTDYDGDEAYGDYQVVTFQPDLEQDPIPFGSTIRGFEAGLGTFEYEADPAFDPVCAPIFDPNCSVWPTRPDASTVKFNHGDHLGTTRHMSDSAGAAGESSNYSAFGTHTNPRK